MAFFVRLRAPESLLFTPGILPSAPSGLPSAFAPLQRRSDSPKRSNQKATPETRPLDILVQRVREAGPGFVDSTSVS